LENLIQLAKEGSSRSLDLSTTVKDAVRVVLLDEALRLQLIAALTEDNRLHLQEVASLAHLVQDDLDVTGLIRSLAADLPSLSRQMVVAWSDRVLASWYVEGDCLWQIWCLLGRRKELNEDMVEASCHLLGVQQRIAWQSQRL
jgi:hypothetical protein